MVSALIVVLVSLGLAYFFGEVSRKLGLPRVIGQIFAGIFLGFPLVKKYIYTSDNLQILSFLSNLGIILLFYYIGLETNITSFTKNVKKPVLVSLFNTLLPTVFGFFIVKFIFSLSTLVSLIVSISLGISALTISLEMLDELRLLKTKIGRLMITSGAVDDILELILMAVFFSVFNVFGKDHTLAKLIFDTTIFILIVLVSRIWFIPWSLKLFDREGSSTARFTGAFLLVLLIASLAEFLGIGLLIGALVAGLLVRQTIFKEVAIPTWEEHDISKSIHLISFGFLIPLFFVSVGLNVDLSLFMQNIWFTVLLTLIAIVGTVGGTIIAVLICKGSFKEGIILGWGLNPKGDANLAIAALALSNGIITNSVFTSLVIMALLTTIISSIVFKNMVSKKQTRKHTKKHTKISL